MEGKTYLIGCGIAKEHLTIEAINAINSSDILFYDRLIDKDILKINKKAKKIYVGKTPGESSKQRLIHSLFLKFRNKKVARLHSGDSFIFGRGYEECLFLRENRINFEVIPGISAFQVLEKIGIPLTYRKSSSSVALITGSRADGADNYTGICADTLVFYMPVLNLERIISKLKSSGNHLKSDFILVENGFRDDYRIVNGNIGNILDLAKEAGIEAPSLLVVGKIRRKLDGDKVLLFRQKDIEKQTKKALSGFNVVNIPLIKITNRKLDNKTIPRAKIYAFTSPNAVKSVFSQLKLKGKFVAIGDITKKAIEKFGYAAVVPKAQSSDGLMHYLAGYNKKDVVVFCSKHTHVRGFKKVYCYDSKYLKDRSIRKIICKVDIIFPTSSEILRHLVKIAPVAELNKKVIIVIGPKVALEAGKLGLHVDFMLEKPDIGGLNDLL